MAGTVVTTEITHGSVKLVKFAWTSSAGGAADDVTTKSYTGEIIQLTTDPGATAPTADYDVAVTENNSIDVLAAAGADRSATVTETVLGSSLGCVVESVLTLAVTNAGDSKVGTVYVYIR